MDTNDTHDAAGPAAFRWSAQQYCAAERLLLASGFGADGLTFGTLAAMLIADHIAGKRNPYAGLYTPRRFTPLKSAGDDNATWLP